MVSIVCLRQAVGKVVSAAVVGVMVQRLRPRTCLLMVAALPILVVFCSFVMREERKPIFGALSGFYTSEFVGSLSQFYTYFVVALVS